MVTPVPPLLEPPVGLTAVTCGVEAIQVKTSPLLAAEVPAAEDTMMSAVVPPGCGPTVIRSWVALLPGSLTMLTAALPAVTWFTQLRSDPVIHSVGVAELLPDAGLSLVTVGGDDA